MTAGTWLDHKQLMIIKGIGKTPGDTYSAENDPVIVNLMGGVITLDEWTPNIAQVKNGGVWTDSPLSDGRELLAAAAGNVIEKISIIIADNSYLGAMKALSGLNAMANDCRDYWQSEYQIDPVYLAWWAGCGIGSQYALLSNIEVAPDYQDSPSPTIRASITLEREPYWRGIPPGANPKLWTFYVNGQQIGTNKTFADATLVSGSDHLITQTISNKFEWTPAAYGLQVTPISKNYIDITAAQVPGDAPALVEMAMSVNTQIAAGIYVGTSSKKMTGIGHDGVTRACSLILNAGDGNDSSVVTKTAGTSNSGVISNNSSVTYYFGRRNVTGVDAAYNRAVGWGGSTANPIPKLDREFYRGTYAVFVRAHNSSAAAVLTDMKMRVLIEEFEDNAANESINSITLPEQYVPLATGTGYPLTYMGTVTIPLGSRAVQSPLGYGLQLQESNSNLRITVQQQVLVATANRIFDIVDLIMLPIDEGLAQLNLTGNTISTSEVNTLDNTGYLTRGQIKQSAVSYITNATSGGISQEVRGQNVMLKPRTNQRLYFLVNSWVSTLLSTFTSIHAQQITVRLNIIPRWAGIRDV